jgi:hypothetical protein
MKSTRVDCTIIPAQPGWSIVTPIDDADGSITRLHRRPVIGWRVETYARDPSVARMGMRELFSIVVPVDPDGCDRDADALQCGDGPFFTPNETIAGGDDALIAYFRRRRAS